MSNKILHVIDGSGYIFRAFYAIRPLSTARGEPTNAVYGFTTMIEKALREEKPEYLAITFDAGGPNFRHALYKDYKANRPPAPEDLVGQIPRIHQISDAFKISTFRIPGCEADDVIATLVKRAREADFDVVIVTGDKDLSQLVDDHVRIFEPMNNVRLGAAEVEEKNGVAPHAIADALALAGDTSDNVPGVRGVGLKTAAKLLHEHGNLDGVLAAAKAGRVKGKIGETLAASEADARLSRELVSLRYDIPLPITSLEELRYPGPDKARLKELYVELEFRRLVPKLEDEAADNTETPEADPAAERAPRPSAGHVRIDRERYRVLSALPEIEAFGRDLVHAQSISLALETQTNRMVDTPVIGLAVGTAIGEVVYIPIGHVYLGVPKQASLAQVLAALRPALESVEIKKVSAESKMIVQLCLREGIYVRGLAFDSTLASYLLEPDETQHGPIAVARRYLDHEPIERATMGKSERTKEIGDLEVAEAAKLVGERADVAAAAAAVLGPELDKVGLLPVLLDVELPLIPVLADMELAGVKVDVEQLSAMSDRFAIELQRLEKVCFEAAGHELNIGSPKQLQKVLFEELGLRIVKSTKTGPSTDHAVLEQLANDHPLPQAILDYRQVQKLKSTYVDALPRMVSEKTGRVHTVFNQATAATGRLSSNDPNLQNIPIRSELGRTLRQVFVAEPGYMLVSVDYSQIELRILAHFCKDPVLTQAFLDDADVHTRTASVLFAIPPEQVSREQRTQAKAVNFGVLYGMGPMRLARDLKLSRRTADQFIHDYFERQPGVQRYIDETLAGAQKTGEVRTILGRRRLMNDINSRNRGARTAAERVAINSPIQGSAADVMKLAMIRVHAVLAEQHPKARLILQVHDELLVETPASEAQATAAMVKREMEHVFPLDVPLRADAHVGANWDQAH